MEDGSKQANKPAKFTIPAKQPVAMRVKNFRPSVPAWPIRRHLNRAIILPLVCLVLGLGGGYLGAQLNKTDTTSTAVKQQYVSSESQLIASIARNVGQSVVSVEATSSVTTPGFFGIDQTSSQESAGTGFVVSASGIIVTNRHVVPVGTSSVSVTLADGTRFDNVQIIGRTSSGDPLDVAFLKITDLKGKKLVPVSLGDSSKVKVGDRVVAIGNALGQFQNTVTSGIISGFGRDVTAGDSSGTSSENLTDLFQTDAAINEGNSGGPLVDMNGDVIALNTAVAASAQSIGFAIPVNDIRGLVTSVLKTGKLTTPYLGVYYTSITNDLAYQYSLPVSQGAYVLPESVSGQPAVVPGSPADKAGIQGGDIITKVNNTTVDQKTSLSGVIDQFSPGDKVTLTILRGGKTITVQAKLVPAPNQ